MPVSHEKQQFINRFFASGNNSKNNKDVVRKNNAIRRHGRFALQTTADTFSFHYNISQSLINLDVLDNLPHVIAHMCEREDAYEHTFLTRLARDSWLDNKVDVNPVKLCWQQAGWDKKRPLKDYITQLIDSNTIIPQYQDVAKEAVKRGKRWIRENPKYATDQLISPLELIRKISFDDSLVQGASAEGFLGISKSALQMLVRLTPFIERHINVTKISAPTPIYIACRQSNLFRLCYILWLYSIRGELRERYNRFQKPIEDKKEKELFFLRGGQWLVSTFNPHFVSSQRSILGLAGPYLHNIKSNLDAFYRSSGVLFHLVLDHVRQLEKQLDLGINNNRLFPDRDAMYSCITQRLPYPKHENIMRADKLSTIWKQYATMTTDCTKVLIKGKDVVTPMRFRHYERLAISLIWFNDHADRFSMWLLEKNRQADSFYHRIITNKPFIEKRVQPECIRSLFTHDDNGYLLLKKGDRLSLVTKSKKEYDKQKKSSNLQVQDFYKDTTNVNGRTVILNQVQARRLGFQRNMVERIVGILKNHAGLPFYNLSTATKNKNKPPTCVTKETLELGVTLCKLVCGASGAQASRIFVIDYAHHGAPIRAIGQYATDAILFCADEVAKHFERQQIQRQEDGQPISYLYRAIESGSAVFVSEVKHGGNADLFGGKEYRELHKSAIALPLIENGRVFGILQIIGTETNQFSLNWLPLLTRIANLVGPFFYQQRLMQILGQTQAQLNALDVEGWNYKTNPLEIISAYLCNVFLCRTTHIWFQGKGHNTFELRGHNCRGVIQQEDLSPQNERVSFRLVDTDATNQQQGFCNRHLGLGKGSLGEFVLQSEERFNHVQGRYNHYKPSSSFDNASNTHQLDRSFISKTNHPFRKRLFTPISEGGQGMTEIMAFAIAEDRLDAAPIKETTHPLLGFIILYNDNFWGYNSSWHNIIQLLARDIEHSLAHTDAIFSQRLIAEQWTRHEMRAEINAITKIAHNTQATTNAARDELQRLIYYRTNDSNLNKIANMLKTLAKRINRLHNPTEQLKHQLEMSRNFNLLMGLDITIDQAPPNIKFGWSYLQQAIDTYMREERNYRGVKVDLSTLKEYHLHIDPRVLRHIVTNALENAFKYASDNSVISISLTEESKLIIKNFSAIDVRGCDSQDLIQMGVRAPEAYKMADGDGIGLAVINTLSRLYLRAPCDYSFTSNMQRLPEFRWRHRLVIDFKQIHSKYVQ